MAATFVGRGLGMVAAVAPLAVVTPAIVIATATVTYHILAESSDTLTAEDGNQLRSE